MVIARKWNIPAALTDLPGFINCAKGFYFIIHRHLPPAVAFSSS
jgi:hypothetical protein